MTLPSRCDKGSCCYQMKGGCWVGDGVCVCVCVSMCVFACAGRLRSMPGSQDGGSSHPARPLFLIPVVSAQMIWKIILIILNAITVAPAPLPTLSAAG